MNDCHHEYKTRGIESFYKDGELVYCINCHTRDNCDHRQKCAKCGNTYVHFVKSHDAFLCEKCENEIKNKW